MINFERIVEKAGTEDVAAYYASKRETVLETIKPICEAFGIKDYDYVVNLGPGQKETLIVEGQKIGCSCNSIGATVRELITYIFIESGGMDKIYHFKPAVRNELTEYWIN